MERCLYCNDKMPLSRSLAGNRFCTDEHQSEYRQRMERSFLERLNHSKTRPGGYVPVEAPKEAPAMELPIEPRWDPPAESAVRSPLSAKAWVRITAPKRPALAKPAETRQMRPAPPMADWADVYRASASSLPPPPASRTGVPAETFRPPQYPLRREFGRRARQQRLRVCPPKPAWAVSAGTVTPVSILKGLELVLTEDGLS
ncbi:MAG: hypothetical protein U0Q16_00865 [Bryobacteraceae bacterium]